MHSDFYFVYFKSDITSLQMYIAGKLKFSLHGKNGLPTKNSSGIVVVRSEDKVRGNVRFMFSRCE